MANRNGNSGTRRKNWIEKGNQISSYSKIIEQVRRPLYEKKPVAYSDQWLDNYQPNELQNIQPLLDLYLFSYMRTCAMYDSTVKAIGYDEIRVRYRQQRRFIIRDIIINKLTGSSLRNYISSQIAQIAKEEDRESFLEDVMEDLKEIDASRIAGLGISSDLLNNWIALQKNSEN